LAFEEGRKIKKVHEMGKLQGLVGIGEQVKRGEVIILWR